MNSKKLKAKKLKPDFMQQTFYIDSDEEISSVIERLRKSLATENFFVLSKRALVMQSVVNLKLLKREADKMHKKIVIVTQDEISANMAGRAGLAVRSSVEGLESSKNASEPVAVESAPWDEIEPEELEDRKGRLKVVGSNEFFDAGGQAVAKKEANVVKPAKQSVAKRLIPVKINLGAKQGQGQNIVLKNKKETLDPYKEEVLERIYTQPAPSKKPELEIPIKGRTKKVLALFVILCALTFIGTALYLFVPKATIIVTVAAEKKKVDADVLGNETGSAASAEVSGLPVQILHEQQEVSFTYEATGQSTANSAKAHGKVTIYNEYSAEPQTLIATTRLEAADGKIFRLLKNVVVPGTTNVGGETKPGAIEADVVADEAGDAYNVEATTFTIPGFKDTPKFEKFSAKSTGAMQGGGIAGNAVKVVSLRDLENAKKDAEQKLKEKLKGLISAKLDQDAALLEEALQYTISQSTADAKLNAQQDSFNYSVKGELAAMTFMQADVRKILVDAYQKETGGSESDIESVRIDYAGVTPDFDKRTLSMKLHSEFALKRKLDAQQLKSELLGKDEDEVAQIVKKYPGINKITFEFEPTFVSRVPQYAKRVSLEVKTEE